MASSGEADNSVSSNFYFSVAIHSSLESTIREQLWWMYPVARFFAHALYEYYYDIDYIDCAGQMGIQKRNRILYESYCNLVGSLMIMYANDNNTTVYNVIKQIKDNVDTQPNDQGILNLLRAVYGIEHFGYTIMRYCGLFKLSCCEDMKACLTSTKLKLHTANQHLAKEVLLDYIGTIEEDIQKNQLRSFEFLKYHESVLTKEMHLHGPYICQYGILLNYPLFSECDNIIKDIISKVDFARKSVKSKCTKGRMPERKATNTTLAEERASPPCVDSTFHKFTNEKNSCPISTKEKIVGGELDTSTSNNVPQTQFESKLPLPQHNSPSTASVVNASAPNSQPALIESKRKEEKFHSPALVLTSTLFSTAPMKWNLITLPKDRQKFVLHEYDCRMKKHIAFQAANFELQDTKKHNQKLSNLVHQQRRFEEMWPSKRSEANPSIRITEFFDENVLDPEIKELDVSELVKEAGRVIMLLRYTLEEL